MRFKQYLTEIFRDGEIQTIDDLNNLIKKDCKPYLNLIKGKDPLYRGMNRSNGLFGEKKTKNKRIPSGSDLVEFKFINNWLKDNNHNDRKTNICICTSNLNSTSLFGDSYYVFPIGKISYTWMDAIDFNITDRKTGWLNFFIKDYINEVDYDTSSYKNNPSISKWENGYRNRMKKSFSDYFHTNTGFDNAYNNQYEFWFNCKSYYYISVNNIKKQINAEWDKNKQVFK